MPWTCFLPCGNGSHGVRRAFFGVFCSSSCLHMIRRRQRWPSDIPSERSESDFAVFRSRGASFSPCRDLKGYGALQFCPSAAVLARSRCRILRFLYGPGWGTSGENGGIPKIYTICTVIYTKRRGRQRRVGALGCLVHQNGDPTCRILWLDVKTA